MASIVKRTTNKGETRYDVRYRTPDGTPRKETYRTRRAADQRASAVETDKVRGAWVDPRRGDRPFAEIAAKWLAANPGKRESSRARDESILTTHVLPALGGRRVNAITPADVQGLVHGWNERMAATTVRRAYSTVRAVFSYAVDDDLIARSPCRGIKLPPVGKVACRVIDGAELVALADALGPDTGAMAYLGAVLGLRWGEAAGLRVGRLDFLAGTITVAEQLTRGAKGAMVAAAPKSEAGRRVLAAPRPLMDLLAEHREEAVAAFNATLEHWFRYPRGENDDDCTHTSHRRHRVRVVGRCRRAHLRRRGRSDHGSRAAALGRDVRTAQGGQRAVLHDRG